MKTIQNVLYVTIPTAYLFLDGENVVIQDDKEVVGRIPFHNINGWVSRCQSCFDGCVRRTTDRLELFDAAWAVFGAHFWPCEWKYSLENSTSMF